MNLRPYQQEAVDACYRAFTLGQRPVAQLATGTGKSLIIAEIARRWDGPVLVLAHVKELIQQNVEAFVNHTGEQAGIYCAGLGVKNLRERVTFATVQSIQAALMNERFKPTLVLIDEAHRVPNLDTPGGLFHRVLKGLPRAAVGGLTATPWRLSGGLIYGRNPEQNVFNLLAYEYSVRAGVGDKYLAPLVGVETELQLSTDGLHTRHGDYVLAEIEPRLSAEWLRGAAASIGRLAANRKHIALYAPSVASAEHAAQLIAEETGWTASWLYGGLPPDERDRRLADFKSGATRVLCSVDILTTGFNFPELDCVVVIRPTQSTALWQQIMGRGTRIAPGKKNCLLLDFAGNLDRLGGVDAFPEYSVERGGRAERTVPADPRARRPKVTEVDNKASRADPMAAAQRTNVDMVATGADVVVLPWKTFPGRSMLLVKYKGTTMDGQRIEATQFLFPESPERFTLDLTRKALEAYGLYNAIPTSNIQGLRWQLRAALKLPKALRVTARGQYWNIVNFGE